MFILQIHSIGTRRPFSSAATTSSSAANFSNHLSITELHGVVHLFPSRSPSSTTSLTSPSARSTKLFVVSVPNYLSPDDFLLFFGSHLDHFSELCFLRNDGMEDRYSVLITLANQLTADRFYCNFNGKRFRSSEAEVCHIYFAQSAESFELAEEPCSPLPGFVELPTCPVCLERLDQDTSGIQTTLCDHSFQCPCVLKWTYLSCQVCRLCQQQNGKPSCTVCGTLKNLWVCLICGFVGCGRYEGRHAIRHWKDTQHCYSLGLERQQVWDYVGHIYVHRLNQSKADAKSVMMNSRCLSHHEECGTCGCSEDSGISGALFDSKVEAIMDEYNRLLATRLETQRQIMDEYNRLLATRLETQRQHFEVLLIEAKSKMESSIPGAVEKALASRMHDIQSKLEKCVEEKVVVDAMANDGKTLVSSEVNEFSPNVSLGEHSSLQLTSVKLDGSNYLVWSRSFQLAITARGMSGYIKGVTTAPKEDGSTRDKWLKENALVMTWLINSIHPSISHSFVSMDTAHEIWTVAAQMYSQRGNDAQAYELRKKIRGFDQKDRSLAEYYAELSSLWQELDYYQNFHTVCSQDATIFRQMVSKERVYDFLAGLNIEYDQIRVQILGRDPFPTLCEAYAYVQQEESRRSAMVHQPLQDRSALVVSFAPKNGSFSKSGGKGGSIDRSQITCDYCGKDWNDREHCWKLHGRLPRGRGSACGGPSGRGDSVSSQAHLSESFTSTPGDSAALSHDELHTLRRLMARLDSSTPSDPPSASNFASTGTGYGENDWQW